MADVNKSVEISYRADLKQLINQLEKMPGVTEKEAKKMVAQLDRQFKRAERSAKKAAKAQTASMRQVGIAADKAAVSVKEIGDQAGDLDRAFMGAALAANLLNPAMGKVIMLGSDAAAIFEAVTLGLNALNPVFLGIAAVVGTAAGAFALLNAENEERLDILTRLKTAEDQNRETLSSLAGIITSVSDRYETANEELALFTQQQTQLDVDRLRKTREINRATQSDVDAMSERIRANEHLLSIIQREQTLLADMTEEEKELVKAAQFRFETVSNTASIEGQTRKSISARRNLIIEINKELAKEKAVRDRIVTTGEKTLDIELELLQLKNEYNKAQEEEERRSVRIRAHKEAMNKLDSLIASAQEKGLDNIEKIELGFQKHIDALKEQEHLIANNAMKRIEFTKALTILETLQSKEAAQAVIALDDIEKSIDERRTAALEQLREQQQKAHNARQKELESEKVQQIQAAQTISGAFDQFAKSNLEFLQSTGQATQEQLEKAFKMQQVAGIAQATINGAVAATKALADLGPVAGAIAAGAISAATVAQIAVISSQKPPTSHMGGVLQPDEQVRTVLTGEAVLDRATVNRIGGESGVRSLMNEGSSNDSVVVLQPFRHIDRYNKSARMMKGRRASRRY